MPIERRAITSLAICGKDRPGQAEQRQSSRPPAAARKHPAAFTEVPRVAATAVPDTWPIPARVTPFRAIAHTASHAMYAGM
jgi:hypothetical protein